MEEISCGLLLSYNWVYCLCRTLSVYVYSMFVYLSGISQPNAFQRFTRQSVVTYTHTFGFSQIISTQRHHTMRRFTNLNRV